MTTTNPTQQQLADCDRIFHEWDRFAREGDVQRLLALYAEEAVFESPLVPAILDEKSSGVLRGHREIPPLYRGRDQAPAERVGPLVQDRAIFHRRHDIDLGVSPRDARRRPNRSYRGHGDPRRAYSAPPHLLGLERLPPDIA